MKKAYHKWTTPEMVIVKDMWNKGRSLLAISCALEDRSIQDVVNFISHQRRCGSTDYPKRYLGRKELNG